LKPAICKLIIGIEKKREDISLKERLKEYALLTVGTLFVVVGVYFFKFPNNYAIGGVTGLAMIVSNMLGGAISSATLVTIVNTVLLVIGLIVLGKEFSIKTIYGIDGYEYLRKFFHFTFQTHLLLLLY
jgi:uncharacterized membrane-anchored protein YitT (DUF2179 family)